MQGPSCVLKFGLQDAKAVGIITARTRKGFMLKVGVVVGRKRPSNEFIFSSLDGTGEEGYRKENFCATTLFSL